MADTKRLVLVLASDVDDAEGWKSLQNELTALSIHTFRRSNESGLDVVTGNVSAEVDVPALLETLNGMPAIRNAEEDSWSSNY